MDSPARFARPFLAFAIGVPLAWAVLLWFHPDVDRNHVYASLRDDVVAYQVVHVGTLIFIGLIGLALYLLVRELPGRAARISRLAIGPFVLLYGAWEAVIGLAIGVPPRSCHRWLRVACCRIPVLRCSTACSLWLLSEPWWWSRRSSDLGPPLAPSFCCSALSGSGSGQRAVPTPATEARRPFFAPGRFHIASTATRNMAVRCLTGSRSASEADSRRWAVPGSNGRPPACKARACAAVCCRLSLSPLDERCRAHTCCALLRFTASRTLPHGLCAAARARSNRCARSASSSCQGASQRFEDAVGDPSEVAAFQAEVGRDADAGRHSDLLAAILSECKFRRERITSVATG
jgi:hypothetical protein